MTFATAQDLLETVDPQSLAEVAGPRDMEAISGALLRLTIEGGDRSGYTADEIEAADEALVRINHRLARADDLIKGRLPAGRYNLATLDAPVLASIACDIAWYRLSGDLASEHTKDRNKEALSYLNKVNSGEIDLGTDSSGAEIPGQGDVAEMVSDGRVMGRHDDSFI